MISTHSLRSLAATFGIAVTLAGCSDTVGVVAGPTPVNALFQSYVALGNSITSGYQSGGITDSTQRESYAALLAAAMHTRYAYPSLAFPGCPPPIADFVTQARLGSAGGATATTCNLRNPAFITAALNNVAVPGAASIDPTAVSTANSNALTTLILGGKTQVQRAADAQPTFVSVWIGNNDVLPAALSGLLDSGSVSPGVTPETRFEANYRAMLRQLTVIPSVRGGVLIGVVQVAAAPILFPADSLFNPTFKAEFDAAAGQTIPTVILPSCTHTTKSLISFQITAAIRGGQHPPDIGCEKNSIPPTQIGDIFVLDSTEQVALKADIDTYNAFISQMADSLGWAYYDPNTTLTRLKQQGCISTPPNPASPQPFGACVSLDGVHPNARAHEEIANDMMDAINTKYGTTLAHVTVQ